MVSVKDGDRVQITCAKQGADGKDLELEWLREIRYWITAGGTSKHPLIGKALVGMHAGENKSVSTGDDPTFFKVAIVAIKNARAGL